MNKGDVINNWEYLGGVKDGKNGKGTAKYGLFRCLLCSKEGRKMISPIKRGRSISCCYRHSKHNMCNTKLYSLRQLMLGRCRRTKSRSYKNYGGRGISVCDKRKGSFTSFFEDMKDGYKEGLTLDRIDNDKGYSKENCKWSNRYEQNQNTRKNVYYEGKCIAQRARELGISKNTINVRRFRGMSLKDAIFTPTARTQKDVARKVDAKYWD